jgi:ParB-like chromosome segregation protein Spo0J
LPRRIRTIEITRIEPNCRLVFDREAIVTLARSLLREGQREPIRIWFTGRCFRIEDGEKRWRAARQIGILTLRAVVVEDEPEEP